ncbi:MAG: DUF493 domain-containing protein [Thiotrichales bacterium]|jgi:hypothetical protein|nr:DUF493 domain-containing protein [Thiotrichales bacterium]MBT3613189.1 DUF493 domain-containing protein [Thiotrichales bacterium]MBT3752258.1 DUF493 domain-containing protein [Thiotrichales bacterium]MBT3837629.1 DUF493 domain-containing protein [Thiotrichales bacterium]MBT4261009.1 DUF493 domain-containing protein [Thiotrichales bacterium]
MSSEDSEMLMKFPCEFLIKAMGKKQENFDGHIATLVRKHYPDFTEGAVKSRYSKDGNYISVTVTITATGKTQLDAIYQDLTDDPLVIMAL